MAQTAIHNFDVYQPRNPKASSYYKCVENHFEDLERVWDDMYASRYAIAPGPSDGGAKSLAVPGCGGDADKTIIIQNDQIRETGNHPESLKNKGL